MFNKLLGALSSSARFFSPRSGKVYRASVRGAGAVRIVEIRADDHTIAIRKIERRYDGARVEWIHQKAA